MRRNNAEGGMTTGRRIRIIERKPVATFSQELEDRVQDLLDSTRKRHTPDPVVETVERDLALALSHIRGVRQLHAQLRHDLVRVECYIETEIIQREPREPVYVDRRIAERDMLHGRLLTIGQERRRLALAETEKLHVLHDRLQMLMHRWKFLGDQ